MEAVTWSLMLVALTQVSAQFDFDFSSLVDQDLGGSVKVVSSSTNVCEKYTDLLVVAEYPTQGRAGAHDEIKTFYSNLKTDAEANGCIKLAFVVADSDVVVVKEMTGSGGAYPDIDVTKSVGKAPKQNILKVIEELNAGQYFEESKDDSEKLILLILSSPKDGNINVADKMKSVLEARNNDIDGESLIPTLKFKVIAVGVAEGKSEDLYRMTFERNRNVVADSWNSLDKNERSSSYNRIFSLIKDPKYVEFTIGSLGASKEGEEALDANTETIKDEDICRYALDVAFLVDSSYSIRLDWDKELYFMQRIANRLDIKSGGVHAGVVVFSDLKKHTRVEINMTDYQTVNKFNTAVQKLPYIGYRTRMDYGFEKVIKELFTQSGGVRPKSIGKLVILITDGKQNPTNDKKGVYDPVAASQPLIDDDVAIVAIGIGDDVNIDQLNNITRDSTKVAYADSIATLISDGFVKGIAKKICETGGTLNISTTVAAPTTCPTKKTACSGVGGCSTCCGSRDVYINIFNSGGNYVVQGMQVQQSSGQISGAVLPAVGPTFNLTKNGNSVDNQPQTSAEVIKLIQTLLPQRPGLAGELRNVINEHDSNKPEHVGVIRGSPGVVRRRRSLEEEEETQDKDELSLFKIARHAGCRLFLNALRKQNLLKMLTKNNNMAFTVFCPTDVAFKRNYNMFKFNDKELLMNHIVLMKSRGSTNNLHTLETQVPGSKIRMTPHMMNNKFSWKANNANILFSLVNNGRGRIMVIDDVMYPNAKTLDEVLRGNSETSMFYKLLQLVPMQETMKYNQIEKICFQSGLCASLHDSLRMKLQQNILQSSAFTILAPTNREMMKMNKNKLNKLRTDRPALITWLKEHFFIGRFVAEESEHEELLVSIAPSHSVLSRVKGMVAKKSNGMRLNVLDRVLETKKSISFGEGIVHVYESI